MEEEVKAVLLQESVEASLQLKDQVQAPEQQQLENQAGAKKQNKKQLT